MSNFSTVLNQFCNDCFAVILSVAISIFSGFIGYLIFGESSSGVAFFVSLVIAVLVGGFGSCLIVKLISKQHPFPILLLSSVLLLTFMIILLVYSGFSIKILFSKLDAFCGGIVGILATGIMELGASCYGLSLK